MAFKIPEMLFSTFQGPSSPVFPQKSAFHHLYINIASNNTQFTNVLLTCEAL